MECSNIDHIGFSGNNTCHQIIAVARLSKQGALFSLALKSTPLISFSKCCYVKQEEELGLTMRVGHNLLLLCTEVHSRKD